MIAPWSQSGNMDKAWHCCPTVLHVNGWHNNHKNLLHFSIDMDYMYLHLVHVVHHTWFTNWFEEVGIACCHRGCCSLNHRVIQNRAFYSIQSTELEFSYQAIICKINRDRLDTCILIHVHVYTWICRSGPNISAIPDKLRTAIWS